MRFQFACLVLVLLFATVFPKNGKNNVRYKKFKNQHIIKKMNATECDGVIKARNIKKNNKCKAINTFILADEETVKAVCVDKGEPYGDMTKSHERFDIVVCKLEKKQGKSPKCHYSGKKLYKKIIIKCVNGLPVHYDGDIYHCDN